MNSQNYGFMFNNIEIRNNIFVKSAKNEYGSIKIKTEIEFYKNIIENKIDFQIPKIYLLDISISIIEMEYLSKYYALTNTFYTKYSSCTEEEAGSMSVTSHTTTLHPIIDQKYIIDKIIKGISILHNFTFKNITKEEYIKNIHIEIYDKIVNRFNDTKWENTQLNQIHSVNGIKIKNIHYYLQKINYKIMEIINKMKTYNLTLIHGDIHLGNILINDEHNICFIDPRGYFGNSGLFGVKEYDYAKLLFGLSGYSVFDEMQIETLQINNGNIEIEFIDNYCHIFETGVCAGTYPVGTFDEFTKLLSLSIWLGNNSNFIDDNKKITSLMIAFYLCEKYFAYSG